MNNKIAQKQFVHYTKNGPKTYSVSHDRPENLLSSEHQTAVVVEWAYGGGLPSSEMELLIRILDRALRPLLRSGQHIMTHCIWGCGVRELTYYTTSYDSFMEHLNHSLAHLPSLPIEISYIDGDEAIGRDWG